MYRLHRNEPAICERSLPLFLIFSSLSMLDSSLAKSRRCFTANGACRAQSGRRKPPAQTGGRREEGWYVKLNLTSRSWNRSIGLLIRLVTALALLLKAIHSLLQ